MCERYDRLDLVLVDDPAHGPLLLPGASIDPTRYHRCELFGKQVIVPVPPKLLTPDRHDPSHQRDSSPAIRK
jgi:hypothetical protein